MKFLILFFFSFSLFASSIDTKIKSSKNNLLNTQKEHKRVYLQLSKIAKSIKKRRAELAKMEDILAKLAVEQNLSQAKYEATKAKLNSFEKEINKIDKIIKEKEENFEKILQEQFATVVAMNELNLTNQKAVILKEFYEASKRVNEEELKRLKEIIKTSTQKKAQLQKEYIALKLSIANLETKRRLYEDKKKKVEQLLAKLQKDEELYRKRLSQIIDRQNQLRKTLAKLNILKKEEVARVERLERQRKAQLEKRAKALDILREKARKRGKKINYQVSAPIKDNSIQKSLTSKYRGSKTISPIQNAKIARRFGTYIDPIYKMKIFNDALILKAPYKGAKVRAVLNGKVVYVGENSVMGKVVIIKHSNHLHTTYSGLAGISPLIKVGKRVTKGTPIGIVKSKLIFRATQNSKFIDPLKLIKL